jgi:uncharacterized RDD family membrane protein YckC
MPTVNEFWQVAAQIASERGGLVVGFAKDADQPRLGSALNNVLGFTPQAPATVASASDWADWVEQVEAFYRLRPEWGRGKRGQADANYYRVKLAPNFAEKFGDKPDKEFDSFDPPRSFTASASLEASSSPSTNLDIPSFGGYAAPVSAFEGVSFGPRLLARIIDAAVHYIVSFTAGFLFVMLLTLAAGGHPPEWVLQRLATVHLAGFLAGVLGLFAYHAICTSVHGSTAGKMVLAMQVTEDDGTPCRPKPAIIRELGFFVDAIPFGLIGYFAMREDPEQKRHGDRWAGTIVRKRAQVPSASRRSGMQFAMGLLLGIAVDMALLMIGWLIQMNT